MTIEEMATVGTYVLVAVVLVVSVFFLDQMAWDNRAACMDYCAPRAGVIQCSQVFVDGASFPTNCMCECYNPEDRAPVYDL